VCVTACNLEKSLIFDEKLRSKATDDFLVLCTPIVVNTRNFPMKERFQTGKEGSVTRHYPGCASSSHLAISATSEATGSSQLLQAFRSLTKRDLPPTVLRLLLNMYTRQVTRISWNGVFSRPSAVSSGVKQGGILSPILFCIYIQGSLDK